MLWFTTQLDDLSYMNQNNVVLINQIRLILETLTYFRGNAKPYFTSITQKYQYLSILQLFIVWRLASFGKAMCLL